MPERAVTDDLTARLRELVRQYAPGLIYDGPGPASGDRKMAIPVAAGYLAARLAKVVREHDFGPPPTEEEISHSQAIVDMEAAMLRADHAERERDEARQAAQDMSEKLDARHEVEAELEEAVRLLEKLEGWGYGYEAPAQCVRDWTDARGWLARHREAQS